MQIHKELGLGGFPSLFPSLFPLAVPACPAWEQELSLLAGQPRSSPSQISRLQISQQSGINRKREDSYSESCRL